MSPALATPIRTEAQARADIQRDRSRAAAHKTLARINAAIASLDEWHSSAGTLPRLTEALDAAKDAVLHECRASTGEV